MTEQYPKHQIEDEIEVRVSDQHHRGTITGIAYSCPLYMYIVQLNDPVEGEFGPQTGLYVPEGILIAKPDVESLSMWTTVGSYTFVDETEDGEVFALDVQIGIAEEGDAIYVVSNDTADGKQPLEFTSFGSHQEAQEYALEYIKENHAAAPGENAEQYLARVSSECDSEN